VLPLCKSFHELLQQELLSFQKPVPTESSAAPSPRFSVQPRFFFLPRLL
jgi:hypothetical protein